MSSGYILLIEDDFSLAEGLQLILQDEGYKVVTLSNGDELENQIKLHKPDLILLDYRLPGKDGASLTKEIRKKAATAKTPVIMMSAGQHNVETLATQAGANAFLGKPFEIDQLLSLVHHHLN